MLKGIDVSNHNGEVNYSKIKSAGYSVVIIKATEGVDFIDKLVDKHYAAARAAGLEVGFYHFMSEKSSPTNQARDFWDVIKDKKFSVIPCLDIETNSMGRSPEEISDRCVEFLEEFKRLSDIRCMIYTGGYFGRDNLDSRVKKYLGWIAHYGVSKPMDTGFKVVGHQYTESGRFDGVSGQFDLNNFTDEIFLDSRTEPIDPIKPVSKELWQLSIQGQEVKDLQSELNKQFNSGLKVDGYFGDATLAACINVSKGATGNITKLIQQRLKNRGYSGVGNVDGIFGDNTERTVIRLQDCFSLVQDGIVGKNTWKALYGLATGRF